MPGEQVIHAPAPPSPGEFWKILAARPVAVPVVAAEDEHGPAGLLALSASHVSASPPAMSVAVEKSTSALKTILAAGHFSISYLPEDAHEVAEIFGGRRDLTGAARFLEGDWERLVTGAPILRHAPVKLDCRLENSFAVHNSIILVGLVEAWAVDPDIPVLLSHGGRYRSGLRHTG